MLFKSSLVIGNIFQAYFFPKITKQFQPVLICVHCTGSQRIIQQQKLFRLKMMFRNSVGVSAYYSAMYTYSTNVRSNFITHFDLEVLLFIIVTKAIFSTLNSILLCVKWDSLTVFTVFRLLTDLSVYIIMSFDFPFVRLFGVR